MLNIEPIDISIKKRVFIKIYHQRWANLNDSDQNVEFNFGENKNCDQIGSLYLDFDIPVRRKDNANFDDVSAIRLINKQFAFFFKESRLSITSGGELEHNKFVGQISTIMRTITSKDGDLLSQFDNNNEKIGTEVAAVGDNIKSTSLKKMPLTITNQLLKVNLRTISTRAYIRIL